MKKVVWLASVAAAFLAVSPVSAASRIVVPEATVNAGVVAKGEVIRHSFAIRNEGTTDLHITEVRPSCGCTAAEFDRVVGPGRDGRVTLVVETRSFQGPISKSALVVSDDPASPQTTLLISATVRPAVEVLPGGFLRIQGIAGEKAAAEVTIVSDEPGFAPERPEAPEPWMKAELVPLGEKERLPNKGPKQFRLRVTTGEGAPEGLLGGSVKVATGIAKLPEMEIPLSGFIRPAVGVSTGKVNFQNFMPEGEPVRRTILLTNNNPKNDRFAVTDAHVSVAGISAEVVPLDRRRIQVVLTVDPKIRKGDFAGTLTVKTNDPVGADIRLPVSGSVLTRTEASPPKG